MRVLRLRHPVAALAAVPAHRSSVVLDDDGSTCLVIELTRVELATILRGGDVQDVTHRLEGGPLLHVIPGGA